MKKQKPKASVALLEEDDDVAIAAEILVPQIVPTDKLKDHPRNYREHPDDQLAHIAESIKANGIYRNIIVAKDWTILAGHGVVKTCRKLGIKKIPVVHLEIESTSPQALKILTGDNEIGHLAEIDDRAFSELLKEIKDAAESNLLGTGYDEKMLAALAMVTRPVEEIASFDAAAEWVGLPEYENAPEPFVLIIRFIAAADREVFVKQTGIALSAKRTKNSASSAWSAWWPEYKPNDLASVRFEAAKKHKTKQ